MKDEITKLKKQLKWAQKKSQKLQKRLKRANKTKILSEKHSQRGAKKLATQKREQVTRFLCRDEHSRLLAGKKDTVTKNKEKVQIRVLLKTLKEIHVLYNKETKKGLTMSYRQFSRLRPFYVTEPKKSDRDTCACIDHENVQILANKLAQRGLFKTSSVSELLAAIVCDPKKKDCMYRVCVNCCYKETEIDFQEESMFTTWQQWERVKTTCGDKEFTNFLKKSEYGTWQDLRKILNEKLDVLAKHHFNWLHQVRQCRELKDTINETEVVFHMDFSENYACKLHKEIQAFHFGGSRKQATIHTCVVYTLEGIQSYATLSDSLRHDERAVWAHIEPILKEIKLRNPNLTTIHFMSDGPVTQYRNKKNFYLLSTLPFLMGFSEVSWNFSEKAHGKGAPDGVGGAVKRTADLKVKMGADIQSPKDLFDTLQSSSSSIKYFWVSEEDILRHDEAVPEKLPVIKGTMKIHQIVSLTPGKLRHRELSCFCSRTTSSYCNCHSPNEVDFNITGETEETPTSSTSATPISTSATPSSTSAKPQMSITSDLVGRFVVVKYDRTPFVGQVLNVVGAEVEVSCMWQVMGKNSFVWPTTPDVLFYYASDMQALLSEPEPSTNRSSKLCVHT